MTDVVVWKAGVSAVAASGRVIGIILIIAGLVLGVAVTAYLVLGNREGNLTGSAAVFGIILLFGVLILPMLGGGVFLLLRGKSEAKDLAEVAQERRLLDIVKTRGTVSIEDLVLDMRTSRDAVQADLYDLVGRGLFTGYVDWDKGQLHSVEAKQLQGRQTCPNCGGAVELAGKGLIKCPYCGAEIFL